MWPRPRSSSALPRPPCCGTGGRPGPGSPSSSGAPVEPAAPGADSGGPIDTARWEQIQALFHRAADLPLAAQRAFVETECGGDPALAAEVLALLEEDARGSSLLDRGLAGVAHDLLEGAAGGLPHTAFGPDRKSTRLNSSHGYISYAVFCSK